MKLKLRTTRALLIDGEPVPAGAILNLDAADAQDVLDSGRAVLLDPADAAAAMAARRAQVTAMTANHRPTRLPDGPWYPIH